MILDTARQPEYFIHLLYCQEINQGIAKRDRRFIFSRSMFGHQPKGPTFSLIFTEIVLFTDCDIWGLCFSFVSSDLLRRTLNQNQNGKSSKLDDISILYTRNIYIILIIKFQKIGGFSVFTVILVDLKERAENALERVRLLGLTWNINCL